MAHEIPIDDLDNGGASIAILRELLRAIGIWIYFHEDRFPIRLSSDLREPALFSVFRGLITAISTNESDQSFFALQHLNTAFALSDDSPPMNDWVVQPISNITKVVANVLASNCADAYSPTTDTDEFMRSAIDGLWRISEGEDQRYLRYNNSDLLITVPPADQSYSIPLWADDDTVSNERSVSTQSWGPDPNDMKLTKIFEESRGAWHFWRDWYQGFLLGKPLDWELQRRVALIPDEDWGKGAAHIAEKIEQIKAAFLSEKTPLAEIVEFNEETAKFHAVPRKIAKPDLLGATLSQVEDALDDALADQTNGLHDGSREVRVLRRTLTRYANDPQRIEMDFVSVAIGLRRQLDETDELPKTEENQALRAAVEEGAVGIRATHPEVAQNREILAQQSLRELPVAEKAELESALPIMTAITEGGMADDFANDIPALVNDAVGPPTIGAPPVGPADAATRVFSRASKMAIIARQSNEVVSKIEKSVAYKGLGIASRGLKVIEWLTAIVRFGLRLFGVL